MSEEKSGNQLTGNTFHKSDELIDLRRIIAMALSHKYFFIATILSALVTAYIFGYFTMPVYRTSATLLIEEEKKSTATGNELVMEGFSLMAGMKNLDNQIMILSSRSLVNQTLNQLPFDTNYYFQGLFKKRSLYPVRPIAIVFENGKKLPEDVVFAMKLLGNNRFSLDAKSGGSFEIHKKASFGESIDFGGGRFRIERKDFGWAFGNDKKKLYFTIHSRDKLIESYLKRLVIDPASKKGTIVRVSLEGTNKKADLHYLNKMTEIFLNISLDKKNNEAIRTIQFIDEQLAGISDSLLFTENKLQKFRSRNRVMNLSAQGQVIIDQAMNLENEKARLATEANYYGYLAEYLEKDETGEVPIAPATMGITDPGLTNLVADLAKAQGELYSKGMGDKNPMQSQLTQRVQNIKVALSETLKGVMRANSLSVKENQDQIRNINEEASALPRTERELLGIERKWKLNDELYTFLLEKRSVAQMQKVSNVADNEMIDYPATQSMPVKPNMALIYLFALAAAIGIPFLWLFFSEILSVRITSIEEIQKITDLPISGQILQSTLKKSTVVFDAPDSPVSESFRLLRSRMKFFTKDIKSPVILVTSSIPDEGKTFTAINLASAYSLMGRKTILLGFDLRKPGIYHDFGLDNKHGLSTWLIGHDRLEDVIKKSGHENLDIITSGAIPPNPAELTALPKTEELLSVLRGKYDCIIIDTAPIGSISDTFHLVSLADACLLVVRENFSFKDLLASVAADLKISRVKSLSLVINSIEPGSNRYGYSGKYTYNYKNTKKNHHDGLLKPLGVPITTTPEIEEVIRKA